MQSRPDPDRLDGELLRHRDLMVLKWLSEQYAARIDHLQAIIGRSHPVTRNMVRRLRDAGQVRTRHILSGEPTWVIPTRAGLDACGSPYGELFPRSTRLAHIAAVNDVRLYVHSLTPHARWVPKRQLLRESTTGANVPDALVFVDGHKAAFAVEVATKPIGYLRARLEKFERDVEVVYLFCAPGPHRKLARLQKSGCWPNLKLRELSKAEAMRS